MNITQAIPRGPTACYSRAGLAIATTTSQFRILCPVGTGISYAINGNGGSRLNVDNQAFTAGHAVQGASRRCLYLVQIDAAGNTSTVQSAIHLTAQLLSGARMLEWPAPGANRCPIGAILIETGAAATFTPGTTALNAAGVTATYIDFVGGMPQAPLAP